MRWLIALLLSVCAWAQTGPMLPDGIPFASTPTGTFTFVQTNGNGSCASATTCSITLGSSITAGDLVAVCASVNNNLVITNTNNGGTFVPVPGATVQDYTGGDGQISCGYILSASSEATPLVVDWASANGGGVVGMSEWSYTGATPALDGSDSLMLLTQTSFQLPLFTTSGTGAGDISMIYCRDGTINSVSAGFSHIAPQTYAWFIRPTNPVSGSIQPTCTLNASSTALAAEMSFGFSVTPFLTQSIQETSGTATNTVTVAQINATTVGWHGGPPQQQGTAADMTYQTATGVCGSTAPPAPGASGRLGDGGNYTDASATVIQYLSSNNQTYFRMGGSANQFPTTQGSLGVWLCSDLSASDTSTDDIQTLQGYNHNDFNNLHELGDGTHRQLQIECNGSVSGSWIWPRNHWFWFDLLYCGTGNCGTNGMQKTSIYNSSLVKQNALTISSFTGTSGTLTFTNSGNNLLSAGAAVGLTGFTSGNTGLNGQIVTVLAGGLSSTTFEATVTGSGYASGAGSTDGSLYCPSLGTTPFGGGYVTYGDAASNAITAGAHWWYYHNKLDLNGTDPLLP